MPQPRHGIWASVIGNKIYLAGGGTVEGLKPTSYHDVFIVTGKATFGNISTRLKVEPGENVLIGGFIITGTASKRIILRAIGPSFPVSGALANPRLELFNAAGQIVAANDNWRDAPNQQEISDSIPPSHDLESAILTTVAPGGYTVVVRGENDSTGVALVEVYDLEAGSDSSLANISTRGFVQTGEDVLIGGLILTGLEPRRVIVRAIGPSFPWRAHWRIRRWSYAIPTALCWRSTTIGGHPRRARSSPPPFRPPTIWNRPLFRHCRRPITPPSSRGRRRHRHRVGRGLRAGLSRDAWRASVAPPRHLYSLRCQAYTLVALCKITKRTRGGGTSNRSIAALRRRQARRHGTFIPRSARSSRRRSAT